MRYGAYGVPEIFYTKRGISYTGATEGIIAQFDAAFGRRNARFASGIVVRDQMGDLKASKIVIHEDIPTPFVAEALAGLDAMKLVIEMELTKVMIEGDSKTVIQKCQRTEMDKSVLGAIIYDIQSRRFRVEEVIFKFIHRTKNIQAHNLAKAALVGREDTYLGGETMIHSVTKPEGRWREPPD